MDYFFKRNCIPVDLISQLSKFIIREIFIIIVLLIANVVSNWMLDSMILSALVINTLPKHFCLNIFYFTLFILSL